MIDLTKWFMMPSVKEAKVLVGTGKVYGRETHHLEGMNTTNNTKVYAYHVDTGKAMWFPKTPRGFPWDIKQYDEQWIYDTGTELDWTNPKDVKLMTPKLAMCPRYWDGDETVYQFHAHAAYDVIHNCLTVNHGDVGPAYYTIQDVGGIDYLGDVGIAETILITYYWGDKKHREQLFLTNTAGWVRWTHAVLTQLSPNTADYVVDANVVHNKIVPGIVNVNFPCTNLVTGLF